MSTGNNLHSEIQYSYFYKQVRSKMVEKNSPCKQQPQEHWIHKCQISKKMKKIDFKTKIVIRHEEEHFIMLKESHHQEDISAINMHSTAEPQNILSKTNRIEGLDNSTTIIGDFILPLSMIKLGRSITEGKLENV